MNNVWSFVTAPQNSPLIGGISLITGIVSLIVTIGGFWTAIYTIRQAKTAAEAADTASRKAIAEIGKYDAIKDITFALNALESANKHFRNNAWKDVAESYDEASRALTKLRAKFEGLDPSSSRHIDEISRFTSKLHKRISAGEFSDELSREKTHAVIRQHITHIFDISILIEKVMVK